MTLKFPYFLYFSFFAAHFANAQDIHFSQPNAVPLATNPALTGSFQGIARVGLGNRAQWKSAIGCGGYQTFVAYADMPICKGFKNGDYLAFGLGYVEDEAGSVSRKMKNLGLQGAYGLALDGAGKTRILLGFGVARETQKINPASLNFSDNITNGNSGQPQTSDDWDHLQFDPVRFWDASAGVSFSAKISPTVDFNAGAGFFHINRPNGSFFPSRVLKQPVRTTMHGQVNLQLTRRWSLHPWILASMVASSEEFVGVLAGGYKFSPERNHGLSFGAGSRLNDAFLIHLGLQLNRFRLNATYDVATSDLNKYTGGKGAFELASHCVFNKNGKRSCPTHLPGLFPYN